MSLKAIEMQVALPRTIDAGKIHEQLEGRGQNISDQGNEALQKEVETKRTSVIQNEESAKTKLNRDGEKKSYDQQDHSGKKKKKEEIKKDHHPYKGTIIDYSG